MPVAIQGGRAAMRRGSWIIRPVTVSIRVGEPIETAGLQLDDRDALIAQRPRADRSAARRGAGGRLSRASAEGQRHDRARGLRARRLGARRRARRSSRFAGVARADARAPQPPPPTFRTEANYVRVDVYPDARTTRRSPISRRPTSRSSRAARRRKSSSSSASSIRGGRPAGQRASSRTRVAEVAVRWRRTRARACSCCSSTSTTSSVDGSHNIRKPLVDALDRLIGPDDLVGVMTPEMSAARHHLRAQDDDDRRVPDALLALGRARPDRSRPIREDEQYGACYPGMPPTMPTARRSTAASRTR